MVLPFTLMSLIIYLPLSIKTSHALIEKIFRRLTLSRQGQLAKEKRLPWICLNECGHGCPHCFGSTMLKAGNAIPGECFMVLWGS